MRLSIALPIVVLAGLALTHPAKADTVFNLYADLSTADRDMFGRLTGVFTPDGTFTGTIDINTITGIITSVDLTYTAGSAQPFGFASDTFSGPVTLPNQVPFDFTLAGGPPDGYLVSVADNSSLLVAYLSFPTTSFVGYTGGQLCDTTNGGCDGTPSSLDGKGFDYLSNSTLTPQTSATPEPGSLTLLGTGALSLASAIVRRRKQP